MFQAPASWHQLKEDWAEILQQKDSFRSEAAKQKYQQYLASKPKALHLTHIHHQMQGQAIALLLNEFPYDQLLSNLKHIKHYCLWSKQVIPKTQITPILEGYLQNFVYFESEPTGKSVPELWHIHVFSPDCPASYPRSLDTFHQRSYDAAPASYFQSRAHKSG